jgi:hypothetical protein
MEKEKMNRSSERRLAALEAHVRDAVPADHLLTSCRCTKDACSFPRNACSFDDVSPADRLLVVDLQGGAPVPRRRVTPALGYRFIVNPGTRSTGGPCRSTQRRVMRNLEVLDALRIDWPETCPW